MADMILKALPMPVLTLGDTNQILYANDAAEAFFDSSLAHMCRQKLDDLLPFSSPVISLVDQVRWRRAFQINEYSVNLGISKNGLERIVDVRAGLIGDDAKTVVLMIEERAMAAQMDRQLNNMSAARSIMALGAMLAHEIKNPLSGIKGAAQLLEQVASDEDRLLTRLICDEADRIVTLVEKVELFGDERPTQREALNIHTVLDHVKRLAQSGFARHIRFVEAYDPSLPPVFADRDQLIQVFLNLVKNAAEAIGVDAVDGEITLSSAYRSGVRMRLHGSKEQVALPIELNVRDNGPGIPPDIASNIFDAFITTKAQGTGLGLPLVAQIIAAHGGFVECQSKTRRTTFRVLLPVALSTVTVEGRS
jgi:two-component system, NtrC family, nitrogen regulation sensor histidine kinase GlnL